MICDEVPTKQDTPIITTETVTVEGGLTTDLTTEAAANTIVIDVPAVLTTVTETTAIADAANIDTTANATNINNTTWMNRERLVNYFQTKNKSIRNAWNSHQSRMSRDRDQTHLMFIIIISIVAVALSIWAITTPYWICGSWGANHAGLWDTCSTRNTFSHVPTVNDPAEWNQTSSIQCVRHIWGNWTWVAETRDRADQLMASQGLLVAGTIMYALSLVGTMLGWRFIQMQTHLNALRNVLVMSMFVQIVAFLMHLIGFFLFILTENVSISIGLLFVYFGIAIFATNFINFITIEYKCYKFRQLAN
jgi:hypothetical protein